MKRGEIMTGISLENIVDRVAGARALVCVLAENSSISATPEDALNGVSDLLEAICRDLQADIDAAENVNREEGRTDG